MPNIPVVVLDGTLTNIANAIRGKNGSSDTYKPSEMPAAITAIPSGGGAGIPREVNASGVYGFPTQSFTFSPPADATDAGLYAFYNAFYGCTTLTSVNFSSLTAANGDYVFDSAFRSCTALTSVDFSSLATASGYYTFNNAFRGCTALTSVDFSSLTTVSAGHAFDSAFYGCTALASVDFSSLTTVSAGAVFYSAFRGCTSLASVSFSSLATVGAGYTFEEAFRGCTSLGSLSFPALTSSGFGAGTGQFTSMLAGVTGCTLHFPAATQTKIATLTGYPNFGGTNTTVLFDL